MNAFENLLTRRSIRQYKQDPIPEEVLGKILEAGTYAPTGMNKQAPIIIAVTNREMRDRLSKMNADVMGVDTDPFYGAPCVVVVLVEPERYTAVEDGSLVMGNLMQAAYDIGVGSCWIHRAKQEFESEEGKAILMISEEMPELIGMSDRLLILKDGALAGEFMRSPDLTDSQIIDCMI